MFPDIITPTEVVQLIVTALAVGLSFGLMVNMSRGS